MPILFSQYWDVMPNKFDDYSTFILEKYNPTLEGLGLRLVGGYYVAVGMGPRIVAVAEVENVDNLKKTLSGKEYRTIFNNLLQYVWKYDSRVWAPSGRIQKGPYRIQTGVWKFNQYYNVLPGMEEEHYHFVKEECLPAMKELGVPITGGWRLIIGSGPRVLAEGTASNIVDIAKAIDTSEFRRLVRKLKTRYATDYSSRILAPTGRIEVPYLMREMLKTF
ncbi:MAG: hypothetical protein JRJ78_15210 [Deltaproteobacteria bacterium]|nr:hypothetical protein [Deltaproteobacteria bacterium]